VLIEDEEHHDICAVAKDTLTTKDMPLSRTKMTTLMRRTQRALAELGENRTHVHTMTEAVCGLFERRGLGIELTAKNASEVPLIERKKLFAANNEASSSAETTPELRPAVPGMAE
ncbi:hypothetical protein FOZ62_016630, partial [Perkinsus olseni]